MVQFLKGAVTRKECKQLGRSYMFHIDRLYLRDAGCVARIVLFGHTLDVYKDDDVRVALPRPRVGHAVAFVVGAVVVPSPFFSGWWGSFINAVLNTTT